MNWSEQNVVVIGAARQGTALTRYLVRHGAQVTLTDARSAEELAEARQVLGSLPARWVLGEHPMSLLDGATLVCPSGGVPLTIPLLVEARQRAIPFSNDSQVFMQAVPCQTVGITGSAGKTTTTTLVGRMAEAAAKMGTIHQAYIGGNIGVPLIAQVDEMQADDLVVMELSSFQLELMTLSPNVAAILNISPNHLDRHGTMEAYTAAKVNILKYQQAEDVAVLGIDDPAAWALSGKVQGRLYAFGLQMPARQLGAFVRDQSVWLRTETGETEVMPISMIQLRGEHNLLNVLAACAIAGAAGLPRDAMRTGVDGFGGVEHRLEFVRSWGGADWYNDSKATSPGMSMNAMQAFTEPLVVLAGGRDKKLPWDCFAELVQDRVDHLVLFGEAAGVIQAALQALEAAPQYTLDVCAGLDEAVQAAADRAQPGDVVLLAPGGTSFDEFSDYEARGKRFKELVHALPEKE